MLQQNALGNQRAQAVAKNYQGYIGVFNLGPLTEMQYIITDALEGIDFTHVAELTVGLTGSAVAPVVLGVDNIALVIQGLCQG